MAKKRKYGSGSIRENKNKRAYTVSYRGKSTTVKTIAIAEAKLREWKEELKNYSENEIIEGRKRKQAAKDKTLIEVIKEYLTFKAKTRNNKVITETRDEDTYKLIEKQPIANVQIYKLTTEMICDFIAQLKVTYAYATSKKAYELVHGTIKWGTRKVRNYFSYDLCEDIRFPDKYSFMYDRKKVEEGYVKYYTIEQQRAIEEICRATFNSGKLKFSFGSAILFILYTGLREGEACFLRWKDVDEINRQITIQGTVVEHKKTKDSPYSVECQPVTKTKAGYRVIKLNDKAYAELMKLKEMNGQYEHVISTTEGKVCTPSNLRKKMTNSVIMPLSKTDKSILKVADRVHALRHTFATNEIYRLSSASSREEQIGNAITIVSGYLGHSDITVTANTYNHLYALYVRDNGLKLA